MKPRLYWITGLQEKLAIMPRPRGGEDLADELASLRREGVDVIVNLLTTEEIQELDLGNELDACEAAGIICVGLPIPDCEVPTDRRGFRAAVQRIAAELQAGKRVAIHCRAGIGRSSLAAACVLHASNGCSPEVAFRVIAQARGCPVPDTAEQEQWVIRFCREC